VGIQLTTEQVLTMAPDSSSATAGKKLGNAKHWQNTGQSPAALWGECQGSALYQVRIDLSTLALQCSCPSRKLPCKHGLGLLLLAATSPSDVPEADAPEWITTWLTKRAAAAQRKETPKPVGAPPSAAQVKTAEKRMAQVTQGIERLDLWLNDLIRNGLGSVETKPAKFWEEQAKQMVDAQAPGIASSLRRIATIPNASPDWPTRLLAQLGQLTLLSQAFHHLSQLDAPLQDDVRQLIGWSLKEDEVTQKGKHVSDDWLFLGQVVEDGERTRTQRTWLFGETTQRCAQVLQFAPHGASFDKSYPLGVRQRADLVFWPGIYPQRALIANRLDDIHPITENLPAATTIDEFIASVALAKAQQPWQERFLCILRSVIPIYANTSWCIRDPNGHALPLAHGDHWQLLAYSGGWPVDFAAQWDGETLLPLCVLTEGTYHKL
jgi:hypothetical protein